MDIEWICEKYHKRTSIDVKDISDVLKAVPVLIRQLYALEAELSKANERIQLLERNSVHRPIMRHQGHKGKGYWDVRGDLNGSLLIIQLSGQFDYYAAKQVSNILLDMLTQFSSGLDVIIDLRKMENTHNARAYFHFRKVEFTMKEIGVSRLVLVFDPGKTSNSISDFLYARLKKKKLFKIYDATSIKNAVHFLKETAKHLSC